MYIYCTRTQNNFQWRRQDRGQSKSSGHPIQTDNYYPGVSHDRIDRLAGGRDISVVVAFTQSFYFKFAFSTEKNN